MAKWNVIFGEKVFYELFCNIRTEILALFSEDWRINYSNWYLPIVYSWVFWNGIFSQIFESFQCSSTIEGWITSGNQSVVRHLYIFLFVEISFYLNYTNLPTDKYKIHRNVKTSIYLLIAWPVIKANVKSPKT